MGKRLCLILVGSRVAGFSVLRISDACNHFEKQPMSLSSHHCRSIANLSVARWCASVIGRALNLERGRRFLCYH
jgi:hypothetical protein